MAVGSGNAETEGHVLGPRKNLVQVRFLRQPSCVSLPKGLEYWYGMSLLGAKKYRVRVSAKATNGLMGDRYQRLTANIPWKSFGRKTIATQVKRSLLPVGILPFEPEPLQAGSTHFPVIEVNGTNFKGVFEKYFMNIVGSAIQAGDGKLVTCAHVAEPLMGQESKGYVLSCIHRDGTSIYIPYRIQKALRFVDPRTVLVTDGGEA